MRRTTSKSQRYGKRMSKPKRPMSAFIMWLQDARPDIQAQHPNWKSSQIAKKGGEIWRRLKTKKVWEMKAHQARCRYYRKVATYDAENDKKHSTRGRQRITKQYYSDSEPMMKSPSEDAEITKDDAESVCNCS